MHWGHKEIEKDKIYLATTFYRIHDNEMWYHYWNKAFRNNIDNVTLSNGVIYLSDKSIGTYTSSSDFSWGSTRYIISSATHADIYLNDISYYGMIFVGIKHPRSKDNCNTHKSDLLTCVKTADPQIHFTINRASNTFVKFELLSLYSDDIDDFIGNDTTGIFEWHIYFDCKDNTIKSYLMLKDINDESVIKQTDIIVLCENYYNKFVKKDGENK